MKKTKQQKDTVNYTLGEVFENKYIGNRIIEVLDARKERVGWIWNTPNNEVIVSPHLGFYIWYNEGGVPWTIESGANWLISNTRKD